MRAAKASSGSASTRNPLRPSGAWLARSVCPTLVRSGGATTGLVSDEASSGRGGKATQPLKPLKAIMISQGRHLRRMRRDPSLMNRPFQAGGLA